MSTSEDQLRLLRQLRAGVHAADKQLAEEFQDTGFEADLDLEGQLQYETIVRRRERPVLAVKDGCPVLDFEDASDSEVWKARLTAAQAALTAAANAVGRVEISGRPGHVGTAWLVAPGIVVTNRHVAGAFATRNGESFVFMPGMSPQLDFLQEIDSSKTQIFQIASVLHIEDEPGPDLAFLAVDQTSGGLATPIALASKPAVTPNAAALGYPAYDGRVPDQDLMRRIYRNTYDKKRVAPGAIMGMNERRIEHDCATLGGNSGSVVLSLDSGEAHGLHYAGAFLTANYAVRSDVIKQRLEGLKGNRLRRRAEPRPRRADPAERIERGPAHHGRGSIEIGGGSASITIPLTITVSLGAPIAAGSPRRPIRAAPAAAADDAEDIDTEATARDYEDREGYQPDFLGEDAIVPLPDASAHASDLLVFGDRETVLRYQHFSVVMSQRRRVCRYSAVNIDGRLAKKSKRVKWKWDPRIPDTQQIMHECYGDPPKFSRGHMTRREDPSWGATQAIAKRGNDDSMHVTNAVPQMQAFNSPIWLELEDYALDNAKQDEMRISVFTGPYLRSDDPVHHGVKIPVKFWKIIAFIHDEAGELCATGYEMSQEQSLEQPEFVFGSFVSSYTNTAIQVPISAIEARSGLRFGDLASYDPLAQEGIDDGGPLLSLGQIRFR